MPRGLQQAMGRDYAAELNAEQLAAVCTDARHALVIAGAGSGKTRTLTYRVARLLETGVAPWRILLLTFTNKAAREMLERVASLAGMGAGQIWGGTFHAVANRILRQHAEKLGYRPGFTILDGDDQRALFRALTKEYAGKTPKSERFPKAEVLQSLHSLAVNTGKSWQYTLSMEYAHLQKHEEVIGKIYDAYRSRKMESNVMDFDDLLTNLLRLLNEHADIREHLQERFLHVLVDEYQDTNVLQASIIGLLAGGPETSLMVVGDDAQSIYSWRGANVDHIFEFTNTYPNASVYKIETNYRSVPAILDISNAAIANNTRRFAKTLRPHRDGGRMKPAIIPAPDNRTEAQFIARRIDELMSSGIAGKDIAVLYRAHFHSMDIQMELTRNHIPYRITSGLRFFEQAHVKDIVAWLRLMTNPMDEIAFRRIISTFPRVGEVTATKIWLAWADKATAWFKAHPDCTSITEPHTKVFAKLSVPAGVRPHWSKFLSDLDNLRSDDEVLTPTELVKRVQNYMDDHLRQTYENYEERLEDISQLARSLSDAEDLDAFLSQVALLSETDTQTEVDPDCVTLSTIHQAKGLEWKVVFLIFLGEGLFPHYKVIQSADTDSMEEELRLFYVGVTRAEDQLYLSYPRYNGHSYDSMFCPPSRFLTALDPELYELWNV